jgi:hypothetical protein
MALKQTPKAGYQFEMNPAVVVNPFQNIRGTKDGIEVTLPVSVRAIDKDGKVSEPKPAADGDAEAFKASIEKGKVYKIDGAEMTVVKIGKKKIKLEDADTEIELTPDELYDQAE